MFRWLPQLYLEFNGQQSNKAFGSDFNYIRFFLENQMMLGRVRRNWKVKIRNFVGFSYQENNDQPIQDKFWVAEGNPNQRFKYFYLRSIGSLSAWLNCYLSSDGNLRGYLNKLVNGNSSLAADKLVSVNIEFVHGKFHYLLLKKLRGLIQGFDFSLFFNAGKVWVDGLDKKYLFDAGFRLHFYKMILGKQRTVRVDFPICLSQPELDKFSPSEHSLKFH